MFLRGLRPPLFNALSAAFNEVFLRASPWASGPSVAFLVRRRLRLRRAVTVVVSSAVHGVFPRGLRPVMLSIC